MEDEESRQDQVTAASKEAFLSQELNKSKNLSRALKSRFHDLPLAIQVITIGTLLKSDSDKDLSKSLKSKFDDLRLLERVKIIGTLNPSNDINHTIDAIKMRNDVVHEGWEPLSLKDVNTVKAALTGLVRTVTRLLSESIVKFPTAKQGNQIMPIESWQQHTDE